MENLQKTALVLTIIGALNWGFVGLFDFNLVDAVFGVDSLFANIIYVLIAICGLVNLGILFEHIEKK